MKVHIWVKTNKKKEKFPENKQTNKQLHLKEKYVVFFFT